MTGNKIEMLVYDPRTFFAIPTKKMKIEACPIANRTYFIHAGRIVAVGTYA